MQLCQKKQRLSIELNFEERALRGTSVFELDLTDVQKGARCGCSGQIRLPSNGALAGSSCRLVARGCCSEAGSKVSPWLPLDAEETGGALHVRRSENALLLDAETLDALHELVGPASGETEALDRSTGFVLELAVEWTMAGEQVMPETSLQHFIRLPVHPRDAGGFSDGLDRESSADMDFFLAGHLGQCWFPTWHSQDECEQRCPMEIEVTLPVGCSCGTAGRLVQRKQLSPSRCSLWFFEGTALFPSEVPLIAGPLEELEKEGLRVLAPRGFELAEALEEFLADRRSLVNTLDYPWPLFGCTAMFLPLPHLRPLACPLVRPSCERVMERTSRIHASSLPLLTLHGSVYLFDLTLLGSACPSFTLSIVQPLRSYALASAWFGFLLELEPWLAHGLRRLMADGVLLQRWPSGLAEAEISARLHDEGEVWQMLVEEGLDRKSLSEQLQTTRGSVAESLGPVRELKAYLLCHELCRICGWKAFHQHLAALLSGTKQLSTEQFLEKLAEHPELESRQLQGELGNFAQQWIHGLGAPEVHVGWFYNRAFHRLEFVASQIPLEPLAKQMERSGAGSRRTAPAAASAASAPRKEARGIGFGYAGEVEDFVTGAQQRLAERARHVLGCQSESSGDLSASGGDIALAKVLRKYWRAPLTVEIHLSTHSTGRVQLELGQLGVEPVMSSWVFPPDVPRVKEEDLPPVTCLVSQWPLAKLVLVQPAEWWQGVLEKSSNPAAEADAAKVLQELATQGHLGNQMLHKALQALEAPLKEPGWHEITCAACASALCHWAASRPPGDALRAALLRPVHQFLGHGSTWREDTGLARARAAVARCLSSVPQSLDLWQNVLLQCRTMDLQSSREDPLTLAALEVLSSVRSKSKAEASRALQDRLAQEEAALASEKQRLAVMALGAWSVLKQRWGAEDLPWDFLTPLPSSAKRARTTPTPWRRRWAQAYAMGFAPSSLEAWSMEHPDGPHGSRPEATNAPPWSAQRLLGPNDDDATVGAMKASYPWNRAVRREACAAVCRGGASSIALQHLDAALAGERMPGLSSGEALQQALWTAEALFHLRLPKPGMPNAGPRADDWHQRGGAVTQSHEE
ncbi:unnamed protein product, partial [Durusdinium trenchii]